MYTQVPWPIWVALILSPILLTSIVSIGKDKHEPTSTFFLSQTWNCYDVIWILIIVLLTQSVNLLLVWKRVITLLQVYTYGALFLYAVIPSYLYTVLRLKYRLNISTIGLTFKNSMPNIILGLRIWFLFEFIFFLVPLLCGKYQFVFNRAQKNFILQLSEMPLHQLVIYVLGAIIFAPVVEESLFRGFMYSPFRRKIGHKWSVFLTSLIWSLGHYDVRSAGGLIITGIILAYLYVKTESLLPSIIMHSATSVTGFLIFVYLSLFQNEVLSLERDKFIMFMALFFLTGFIILSIKSRRMSSKLRAG